MIIDRTTPGHLLVRSDSMRLPIASNSIHCVITSPPFYFLRQYSVSPTQWPSVDFVPMPGLSPVSVPPMACCLGLEPDPVSYVGHLVLIFREVRRVLRDDGCCWVNLGDTYAGSWKNQGRKEDRGTQRSIHGPMIQNLDPYPDNESHAGKIPEGSGLKPTDLTGIPWRFAFALQADGWYLRSAPPWVKPGNSMPESIRSRPNVSHEMIFMFTKSGKYFFDMDAVKTELKQKTLDRYCYGNNSDKNKVLVKSCKEFPGLSTKIVGHRDTPDGRHIRTSDFATNSIDSAIIYHAERLAELESARNSGGLLVDESDNPEMFLVNPKSYSGSHYAAWNPALVNPMVLAGSPEKVCPECGNGYERTVDREPMVIRKSNRSESMGKFGRTATSGTMISPPKARTIGFQPTCSCPPSDPIPGIVIDPFSGSGATGASALSLGRRYIGIDLSADYGLLAKERILNVERPHLPQPARRGKIQDPTPLLPSMEDES